MYAQILKSDMRVNLIGGAEEGLPIEHPDVLCVDIGDRTDVKLGMKFNKDTGEFYEDPIIKEVLPSEHREQAYETMLYKEDGSALITWEGKEITVDQANKIYLEYLAEGSTRASEIQSLIIPAKSYIRELFPEE